MRISTCYLPLLLCALPALAAKYRIHGGPIPSCIDGIGVPGERVRTTNCHDPAAIVNVEAHISPYENTYGTVAVKNDKFKLFIGRSKNGEHLEWVPEPYRWEFSPIHGSKFHTVHVIGRDDYWTEGRDRDVELRVVKRPWYFERV